MKNHEALLIEYQIAHKEVDRLNRQIWATSQIIIPFSLTSFGLFGTLSDHSINSIFIILMAAIISIIVIYGWYVISKRWLAYQTIVQFRLLEIEKELDLWCTHYELFKNSNSSLLAKLYTEQEMVELSKKINPVQKNILPSRTKTVVILNRFFILISIAWIMLLLKEVVAVALQFYCTN